jgi:uncharacterized protein YbjQ (UPF0145 family)
LERQVVGNPDTITCPQCKLALKSGVNTELLNRLTQLAVRIDQHEKKLAESSEAASRILCTTASDLASHNTIRILGIVRGVVIRPRSEFVIAQPLTAALESVGRNNIDLFASFSEEAHDDALQRMLLHASDKGANAVIGIRFDTTEIAATLIEVFAYGTAVIVEPRE